MAGATQKSEIGLVAAVSIGVGGMIGAGIFSILGVVAHISGSAMPLSFAIGAAVAGLAVYGYSALGKTFPSIGGSVTFLVRGYGEGVLSGSLNLFQYFSYIITIALYATGFAAYAVTDGRARPPLWAPCRRRGQRSVHICAGRRRTARRRSPGSRSTDPTTARPEGPQKPRSPRPGLAARSAPTRYPASAPAVPVRSYQRSLDHAAARHTGRHAAR
jgi:amino acid transporter